MDLSHSLEKLQIEDTLFAEAYATLGAAKRSVLKKWIAQLYLFWGRNRQCRRAETICWDQGFVTTRSERPLDWGLVILGETFAAPGQLLALLLPMLLAGTRHVVVVRETSGAISFPAPLLVAMELAGQETVLAATTKDLAWVIEHVPQAYGPRGKICCLGAPDLDPLPGRDLWSGGRPQAGIWFDPDVAWDLETIAWTLQGARLHVGGAVPGNLDDHYVQHDDPFDVFIERDFGALYLPHPERLASPLSTPAFGPGQEGGWFWPGISLQTFTLSTVTWHGDSAAIQEEINGLS
ncbi:hypothetical protein [Desulfoplanes formicivorans]|uniref:Uncharacterized protein n=1 Tax=Desulfoplanes formicivorans TaxID=1592317 RepID=A0A194AF96_9BACT|nr:hypothetical protein [Desulfoplanes formicivorans]GAU07870.1 hypothetical protein DPF_0569 [Desulfoplanes formicivorans]